MWMEVRKKNDRLPWAQICSLSCPGNGHRITVLQLQPCKEKSPNQKAGIQLIKGSPKNPNTEDTQRTPSKWQQQKVLGLKQSVQWPWELKLWQIGHCQSTGWSTSQLSTVTLMDRRTESPWKVWWQQLCQGQQREKNWLSFVNVHQISRNTENGKRYNFWMHAVTLNLRNQKSNLSKGQQIQRTGEGKDLVTTIQMLEVSALTWKHRLKWTTFYYNMN